MEFSLILGTLNRDKELRICLDSLKSQVFKDFEVIIIDQSNNDLTQKLIQNETYSCINIIYEHVNFKGLSRSRNYALNLARGSYFALIDDDASYDQLYLMRAYEMFKNNKNIVLSGFIKNLKNSIALKDYLNVRDGQELNIRQIVRMAPSPALIFPYSLYQKGARFDENFGVGAQYGACEETDFILQSLDFGYKVKFSRKLLVFHPTIDHSYEIENDTTIKKIENYASGLGALIAKDKYIRKNNRLRIIRIEKLVKLILKKTGILGSKNKFEAMAEWKGFCYGFKKFVKESV